MIIPNSRVVHCKKSRYDIYIGRPSKWGNIIRIGYGITRREAMAGYREWIKTQAKLMEAIKNGELTNKILGCWCDPLACHGHILVELDEYYNPPKNF